MGNGFQCCCRIVPIDATQIDPAHPEEIGTNIKLWYVARPRTPSGFARFAVILLQHGEHGFELSITGGQLFTIGIKQRYGLLQGKQLLHAPVTTQRFLNICPGRTDAEVL